MSENRTQQNSTLHTRAKSMSRQWLVVFSGKISKQVLSFFIGVLIAKTLGSAVLGNYQLGIVVIQVLTMLTVMGADRGLIRFLPIYTREHKGKAKRIIRSSLGLSFAASLLLAVLLYIFGPKLGVLLFKTESAGLALRAFAFYLPFFTLYRMLIAVFDGFKRADVESIIESIVAPALYILLLIGVSLLSPRLTSVITARILVYMISCGILLRLVFKYFKDIADSVDQPVNLKAFYVYSAPLFLIGTLNLLMNHVDILLTGYYLESSHVGIYTIAQRLAMLSLLALQAINVIFSPHISELFHEQKINELERLFKLFTRWVYSFSLLVFVFYVLFKNQLLAFFGHEFLTGQSALLLLTLGQMINGLGGPNGTILVMTGKQKWMLWNSVLMLFLNTLFNILFIPRWGITGAALATGTSIVVVNILKTLQVYHEFRIHPYDWPYLGNTAVIVAAGAIVMALQHLIHLKGLPGAMAGGIILLTLCIGGYLTLVKSKDDKMIITLIQKRLHRKK
ncbi:MAG: flippase [candidate division KSB1 bacterium]|nr:flippase [candidate division KSB1 bacterium]